MLWQLVLVEAIAAFTWSHLAALWYVRSLRSWGQVLNCLCRLNLIQCGLLNMFSLFGHRRSFFSERSHTNILRLWMPWNLVNRVKGIQMAFCLNAFFNGVRIAALNITVDLGTREEIFSGLPSEHSFALRIGLCPCDIFCLQVPLPWNFFGKAGWFLTEDFTVRSIDGAAFGSGEIPCHCVTQGVAWVHCISNSRWFLKFVSDIVVVDVRICLKHFSVLSHLRACTLYVLDFIGFSSAKHSLLLWSCSFKIIDSHGVSNEFGGIWFYVFDMSKFVNGVQWIACLSCCVEFVPLWPGFSDIKVAKIVLRFVKTNMQLSRSRSIDVEVVICELRLINFFLRPNFWHRSFDIIRCQIGGDHSWFLTHVQCPCLKSIQIG